jgi:hypothetical protein
MKKYFLSFALALTLLAPALSAQAQSGLTCSGGQCTYTPLEPLPCPTNAPDCQSATNNFPALVSTAFRLIITFGGLFAVVMLTIAGIGYMISDSVVKVDAAKSRAKRALWGLVLLMGSWLILNTINPEILNFKLNLPTRGSVGINPSPSGPIVPINSYNEADKNRCESRGNQAYVPVPGGFSCKDYGIGASQPTNL